MEQSLRQAGLQLTHMHQRQVCLLKCVMVLNAAGWDCTKLALFKCWLSAGKRACKALDTGLRGAAFRDPQEDVPSKQKFCYHLVS